MLEDLCDWLNGKRNYTSGVKIYSLYGNDDQLKTLLLKGPTPWKIKKLFEEIRGMYYAIVEPPAEVKQPPVISPAPMLLQTPVLKTSHLSNPATEDPLISACETKAKFLYKEFMNKRAVLFSQCRCEDWEDENSPDKITSRGKLALEVISMNYTVDQAYEDLAYAREHGTLKHVQQNTPQNKYELLPDALVKHELDNLNKNLNKIKKKELTPERVIAIQQHEQHIATLSARWEKLNNQS